MTKRHTFADKERYTVVSKNLVDAIEQGMPIKHAAQYCGINEATYHRWMVEARGIDERVQAAGLDKPTKKEGFTEVEIRVSELRKRLKTAEMKAMHRSLLTIQVASQEQWQAAAWWLERRFPMDFGRRDRIDHAGVKGEPIETKSSSAEDELQNHLDCLTEDELIQLRNIRNKMKTAKKVEAA